MSVIRVAKRARFTTIDRETVRDPRLSFRALGLLTWLLDKPDDYGVSADQIAGAGPDGRDAVRKTLTELQENGYLERKRVQDAESGRWGWEHILYERPRVTAGQPEDGSTDVGIPDVREPDDGLPDVGEGVLSRKTPDLLNPPVVPPEPRGHRIPDDFELTADLERWCRERCPGVDVVLHHERFVNHWRSTPGAKGRKTDWDLTWRNWMLGEFSRRPIVTRLAAAVPRRPWSCSVGNPECRDGFMDVDGAALECECRRQKVIA